MAKSLVLNESEAAIYLAVFELLSECVPVNKHKIIQRTGLNRALVYHYVKKWTNGQQSKQ